MKNKSIFTLLAVIGVFLLINPPVDAQTSESSSSKSSSSSRSSGSSRDARATTVYVTPDIEMDELIGHDYNFSYSSSSSEKSSKLSLSKRYDGESTSKTGTFSVEEGVKKIRLSISGSVSSGKINLELYLPGKKELKKLSIDDSADISWSQSISVPEDDSKYYGEWTYVINVQEAKGKYNLSLSTY